MFSIITTIPDTTHRATKLSTESANPFQLTTQSASSKLYSKERRNSSNSGTHLRQTGGFFVPAFW
ncbi:hypothetical protein XAC3810_530005 [Xanthomonas citri pv. citri]|uniref:Uncharacterized protein n=1 Tax=Xanthomonas citri pv. citri TaxID=611301 RepID=A0A0U5BVZ4_XANCI|nr:hypothetical protein XAC9322_530004 [Xanthomonas citri pv. citri]CEE31447.1 hypothetical protein XAC3824_670005 [Xanthomonas citri pv. citri]CEE32804.1 hypothetical protein XAC1083_520005 [Xanthomonas citri pv. citri]CEE42304.1 hypothetical protein XAC3810_530005 [Xanthomonas citri pv. citri]CEE44176.1 hypothetical protein XAC902_690005 [Xanthomonas citri pv. citri]